MDDRWVHNSLGHATVTHQVIIAFGWAGLFFNRVLMSGLGGFFDILVIVLVLYSNIQYGSLSFSFCGA